MADRTQSILLQVAFKEAINFATAQGLYSIDEVKNRTIEFHTLLNSIAADLDINLVDAKGSGGGDTERELPEGAGVFTVEGETWIDFRGAKDKGSVKAKHPDFKSFDYKSSVWMYDQEGNPNEEASKMVVAAEAALA